MKNLIVPLKQHEDGFAHVIIIQKLNDIKIWLYTPCGDSGYLLKPATSFDNNRKYVRILVWEKHFALIKTIEILT